MKISNKTTNLAINLDDENNQIQVVNKLPDEVLDNYTSLVFTLIAKGDTGRF